MINQLKDLLPQTVSFAWSEQPPDEIVLHPLEQEAARNMRSARLREFAHGRACARQALKYLNADAQAIPVGDHRQPVWPAGFVGSISHTADHAIAIAASAGEFCGLGIDIAVAAPLDADQLEMLCRPEEISYLNTCPDDPSRSMLLFSAKESVFKCIWPALQRFVDFQEIEIRLDTKAGAFTAIAHASELPRDVIAAVHGRYIRSAELIVTAAYRQRSGPL